MIDAAATKRARKRLVQMHYESGVGHIGGNLSCLDALMLLYHEQMNADDRFILSKGHAAGALYIALWSMGKISEEELKTFHKDNTRLSGHPPAGGIDDVLFATGSLGHGLSLAAGTALSKKITGKTGQVYCLTSDGEWQEGSTWEALIFAAHHQLDNLTVLVDCNGLQGFGGTDDVASMQELDSKIQGFDIDLVRTDGHDLSAIRHALNQPSTKCKIILLTTVKGRGVRFMENQMQWHYLPLNEQQYQQALVDIEELGA
jgi:transketolase